MSKKIIIAGAGIAGLNAAKSARDINPDIDITIIESSNDNTYIRTRIPEFLSGEIQKEALCPYNDDWFNLNKITLLKNHKILSIDTDNKTINTIDKSFSYDSLVLALGSTPFVPPLKGVQKRNVFTVRTIEDVEKIKEQVKNNAVCTIIGGGLLGLEIAYSMKQLGCKINIIENNSRLLPRQTDVFASKLLMDALIGKDMNIILDTQVEEICGADTVDSIRFKSQDVVATDIVILSTGVRASLDCLRDSPIECGRAVKINEWCETNIPEVYAAGDIAEYNGSSYCIWPIAISQGKIAGYNAALKKSSNTESLLDRKKYSEMKPFTNLKIKGINLFSIGDIAAGFLELSKYEETTNKYIKLFMENGFIRGAVAFGESSLTLKIKKAVDQNRQIICHDSNITFECVINSL